MKRSVQLVLGILLAVLAFAGVMVFNTITRPPTFDVAVVVVNVSPFTPLTAEMVQINRIVVRQPALVWTPGCATDPGRVWKFVRDLAERIPIIADGGLEPPAGVWELATIAFAVSRKDDPVAAWHEQQLRQAHPGLHVVTGALQAAGSAIAEQVFAEQLAQRPAQGKARILKWLRI